MEGWFDIVYFIGLGLSLLSSSIVLIILLRINFKDHSTKLRVYFTSIDIGSTIFLAIPYLPYKNPIYECVYNAMYYFIIMLHGFWVFFISFFLYMVICRKNSKVKKFTTPALLGFILISFIATIVVLIIPGNGKNCVILNTNEMMIIYLLVTCVGFEVIVFTMITYFYVQIRKVIKDEFLCEDKKCTRNRNLCLRLLGYPILFFVLLAFTELNVVQYFYIGTEEGLILFQIRILLIVYYPCLNSMLYGFTKSSKKFFCSLLLKAPEYTENQELLNDIRQVGFIKDRVYMDLADLSESDILD
ncbi:hypothetical protein SteCoe_13181 [Stentor coeruleus]|uniref:G-protein coupled receptors family 1 profile domain-containing protein n=1 Tax=Stentor coeruleus TaxID=5963 RepID=A0A1R2C953_9CILI|nr:hypothetical protein SteCoe_13181 [Stentor coeruleus]